MHLGNASDNYDDDVTQQNRICSLKLWAHATLALANGLLKLISKVPRRDTRKRVD